MYIYKYILGGTRGPPWCIVEALGFARGQSLGAGRFGRDFFIDSYNSSIAFYYKLHKAYSKDRTNNMNDVNQYTNAQTCTNK